MLLNVVQQLSITTKRKSINSSTGSVSTQSNKKKAHVEDAENTKEISEPLSALVVLSFAAVSKVKMFLQYMSHIDNQQFHRSLTQEPDISILQEPQH